MIVVDIGCAARAGDESVHKLIERFQPEHLWGYDPGCRRGTYEWRGCRVTLMDKAVWTRDGRVGFEDTGNDGIGSYASDGLPPGIECVDVARVIQEADKISDWLVLKIDCEGGEYEIVPHLVESGVWPKVGEWLIEWHGTPIEGLPFRWEPW